MRPTVGAGWYVTLPVLLITAFLLACNDKPSAQPCTFNLTASAMSFDATGGTGTVGVQTGANCAWTAQADANWISITNGASGTGPATVSVTIAANAGVAARNGSLTIAQKQVAVRQEGRQVNCTYTLSPSGAVWSKDGGAGRFDVATDGPCSWTVDSTVPWLTVTSARQGTGSDTVSYTVARNEDSTERTGTIGAGGQLFTVRQTGDAGVCQYTVSPIQFSPCMPATEMTADVVTQAGCPWTAASGASWIAMTAGQSNSGSGTARFRVSENYDAPRNGVVMLRWPTPSAGQNLQIAQAGCTYAVSTSSVSFAVAGGTGSFDVLQQSIPYTCGGPLQNGCVWSAQSNVPWITVTSSMPKFGDDRVSFSVAPNGTGSARTGVISVRDKTVTVTQAGS